METLFEWKMQALMKHYHAKPSAQLSKHLQDDIKHAVMNWSNHKNVHCMRLHNARAICICQVDNHVLISRHDLKLAS